MENDKTHAHPNRRKKLPKKNFGSGTALALVQVLSMIR
jgi:hypothetical protein